MRPSAAIRILLVALFGIGASESSSADALFSPWVGLVRTDESTGGRAVGWTGGGMHGGIIGGEVDLGFSPNLFEQPFDSSALTVMGNLIVGIPIGGVTGPGVRPYVTGGAGLIRTQIDTPTGRDNAQNKAGLTFGGGLMGFFGDHFGVRGDLRYFRTLTSGDDQKDLGTVDLGFDHGSLAFWRATVGVVIR